MNRRSLTTLAAALAVGALTVAAPMRAQEAEVRMLPKASHQAPQSRLMSDRIPMGLTEDHGFAISNAHRDADGVIHSRFHQTFRGVRIWGGEVITHADKDGIELREATRKLFRRIDLSVEPVVSSKEALGIAHHDLAPRGAYSYAPTTELVVYPVEVQKVRPGRDHLQAAELNAEDVVDEVREYRLAYHIHTILENGVDPLAYTDFLIDAHTGAIIQKWSTLLNADARGTGQGKYNGSVTLFTNSNGASYELKDLTRASNYVTNMNKGTSGNGTLYTDADNAWGDGQTYSQSQTTTSANGQTVGVDAAYGQQATWDMYKNLFGRSGIRGINVATYIRVHYGNATADAFYSDACKCVALGDASGSLSDATSIQTVAHELGHAFNVGTANLTYATGETGGLNESNSDITAAAAFFYVKRMGATGTALPSSAPQNDMCWDLFSEEGPALRYMTKPSKDNGYSKDAWSTSLNTVEQHGSSGPNNRMFFFLTAGASSNSSTDYYSSYTPGGFAGIGPDKAYRIWYKAMTAYLTASSKYAAARTACLNAATDLYGANTPEYYAVMNAYAAINVGTAAPTGVTVGISPSTATVVAGATYQFTASVTGSTNTAVTWTCTGGSVSTAGLFTAPTTVGTYTVKATSVADTTKSASATVTVTPAGGVSISITPTTATVLAGATKQFTASVTGSTNTAVTWSTTGGTVSTSGLFTAPAAAGTYTVKATSVADTTKSASATVTVTTTGTDKILNGGFESGTTSWTGTTAVIGTFTAEPAYAGTKDAWFGGKGKKTTQNLYQTVTIPSTATSAVLSFYLHIDTAESGTTAYDYFYPQVLNNSGTLLKSLATYTNANKATGYSLKTFDLTAYKGQTVRINFKMTEDVSLQTSFVVDNVSLIVK